MAELVWTPRAYADLEAIGSYYAQSAPGYAEVLVRKLMQVAERLRSFPASGRIVPEIGDENMWEVIYRNYRVVYMHLPEDGKGRDFDGLSFIPAVLRLAIWQRIKTVYKVKHSHHM